MLTPECDRLKDRIKTVLQKASQLSVDAVEVSVSSSSGLSASIRMGEVDVVEFTRDKSLTLTVYKGRQKGSASTSDIRPEALDSTLAAACQISQYTQSDPFSGLLETQFLAKDIPDCHLYHPTEVSPEQAIELAKSCEDSARAYDKRIVNSDGATFSQLNHCYAYGNSNGFIGAYPSTQFSLSCVVVAKSSQGMERDYEYSVARDFQDLEDKKLLGEQAAKRTLKRLDARQIKTGQVPVIFSARLASGFFGHFLSAISGGQLYRKASFLLESLDKKVFPNFLNIREEPHQLKGLGSAPFDSEGAATQPRYLVEEGILKSYVLSGYSARKLGLTTTGNCGGVHNVIVENQDKDLSALLKEMGTGLLVTELMGHGINLVTGDYSRGAFGYWVEGGEIQYPVHEITIAGNLKELFANLVAVGSDVDKRSSIQSGSVWVDRMTIAGA